MTHRIRGKIKLISKQGKIFGVIYGDDLKDYFFIPSFLRIPDAFPLLTVNTVMEFTPAPSEKGWRAYNVTVITAPMMETTHGLKESHQHHQ